MELKLRLLKGRHLPASAEISEVKRGSLWCWVPYFWEGAQTIDVVSEQTQGSWFFQEMKTTANWFSYCYRKALLFPGWRSKAGVILAGTTSRQETYGKQAGRNKSLPTYFSVFLYCPLLAEPKIEPMDKAEKWFVMSYRQPHKAGYRRGGVGAETKT